jgi:hypothetical protein
MIEDICVKFQAYIIIMFWKRKRLKFNYRDTHRQSTIYCIVHRAFYILLHDNIPVSDSINLKVITYRQPKENSIFQVPFNGKF